MRHALLGSATLLLTLAYTHPALADCKSGHVSVKKTALRRGPGLNYPVSTMIDEGRCWKVLERSTDELWVMIEGAKDTIGWVPASMVDEESRPELDKTDKKKTGPVGSGQERGFVVARTASTLLAEPDVNADSRRVLPSGARLLALALSKDGTFVQVRDDRGETGWVSSRGLIDDGAVLPSLPRMDGGISGKTTAKEERQKKRRENRERDREEDPAEEPAIAASSNNDRVLPRDEDPAFAGANPSLKKSEPIGLQLEVGAMGVLPNMKLDSNGMAAYRRYAFNAFATGAHVEAKIDATDPIRVRLAYNFVLLTGLAVKDDNKTVSGQLHDGRLLIGYPVQSDSIRFVPELGYNMTLFAMQPALPGLTTIQFVSDTLHAFSAGGTLGIAITDGINVELDFAGLIGTTVETPLDLGVAKISLGARGGLGLGFQIGGGAGIMVRYQANFRTAPFQGSSTNDPTITQAQVYHFENMFGIGLTFDL
jgi:hypothetical protein